jgi:hypothetical protein
MPPSHTGSRPARAVRHIKRALGHFSAQAVVDDAEWNAALGRIAANNVEAISPVGARPVEVGMKEREWRPGGAFQASIQAR